MKLNKRLFIGMVAFSVVSNTILGYQLNSKSNSYDRMTEIAKDYRQSFYNAKDATTCLLYTYVGKEQYPRCQQYIEDVISHYKYDQSVMSTDLSKYSLQSKN